MYIYIYMYKYIHTHTIHFCLETICPLFCGFFTLHFEGPNLKAKTEAKTKHISGKSSTQVRICDMNFPRVLASKVVSTHRTGTHPEQPLPIGCKGNPFIVGARGIAWGVLQGCVVSFLDSLFRVFFFFCGFGGAGQVDYLP